MKKEYMTPEVEMTKFEEVEEIMTAPSANWGIVDGPLPDDWT